MPKRKAKSELEKIEKKLKEVSSGKFAMSTADLKKLKDRFKDLGGSL